MVLNFAADLGRTVPHQPGKYAEQTSVTAVGTWPVMMFLEPRILRPPVRQKTMTPFQRAFDVTYVIKQKKKKTLLWLP